MKKIKGPAIFLAQFAGDEAPFNSWQDITAWAADCGYLGVQVPGWDARLIDLDKGATSKDYCDEFKGVAQENGVTVTELSTHLQGQLVAVHPGEYLHDGISSETFLERVNNHPCCNILYDPSHNVLQARMMRQTARCLG